MSEVIKTFDNHLTGIFNAITTQSTSAKYENINRRIWSVITKARGFFNFDRFRINAFFYFGNLDLIPQKK